MSNLWVDAKGKLANALEAMTKPIDTCQMPIRTEHEQKVSRTSETAPAPANPASSAASLSWAFTFRTACLDPQHVQSTEPEVVNSFMRGRRPAWAWEPWSKPVVPAPATAEGDLSHRNCTSLCCREPQPPQVGALLLRMLSCQPRPQLLLLEGTIICTSAHQGAVHGRPHV